MTRLNARPEESVTINFKSLNSAIEIEATSIRKVFVQFKYKKNLQTTMSYTHALETTLFVKKYFDSKKCS